MRYEKQLGRIWWRLPHSRRSGGTIRMHAYLHRIMREEICFGSQARKLMNR